VELPAGVTPSAFGPRLQAHIAALAGVHRLSRRQVCDVVREMFGIPISLGAVDRTIGRMSAALADPWRELARAVREAEAVHAQQHQPLPGKAPRRRQPQRPERPPRADPPGGAGDGVREAAQARRAARGQAPPLASSLMHS
jgi:hypothetical protein